MTTLPGVGVASKVVVGVDSETATVGEDVACSVGVELAVGEEPGVEEGITAWGDEQAVSAMQTKSRNENRVFIRETISSLLECLLEGIQALG